MKSLLYIIFAGIIGLSLLSCKGETDSSVSETPMYGQTLEENDGDNTMLPAQDPLYTQQNGFVGCETLGIAHAGARYYCPEGKIVKGVKAVNASWTVVELPICCTL